MVNHGLFPDHCPCEESMTGDKLIPGRGARAFRNKENTSFGPSRARLI